MASLANRSSRDEPYNTEHRRDKAAAGKPLRFGTGQRALVKRLAAGTYNPPMRLPLTLLVSPSVPCRSRRPGSRKSGER
jgi:hypothetical protein